MPEVNAGPFTSWLDAVRLGMRDGTGTDVPCGTCTACCTSAYFIHVGPDEGASLAAAGTDAIPAPNRPGHKVMGYDENGHCPKMSSGRCAIYADRPRTCRIYDCRVFAAAGISAGPDKPRINERVALWRFEYPTSRDRERHDAVKAAALFIRNHAALFPDGRVPQDPGQLALLAIDVHAVMMDGGADRAPRDTARLMVNAARAAAPRTP